MSIPDPINEIELCWQNQNDLVEWRGSLIQYKGLYLIFMYYMCSVNSMVDYAWKKILYVTVDYTGEIFWIPAGEFITTCSLDLTYFPYDHQTCHITWCTLQSNIQQISLQPTNQCIYDLDEDLLGRNGAWDIIETFAFQSNMSGVNSNNETFTAVNFGITIFIVPLYICHISHHNSISPGSGAVCYTPKWWWKGDIWDHSHADLLCFSNYCWK